MENYPCVTRFFCLVAPLPFITYHQKEKNAMRLDEVNNPKIRACVCDLRTCVRESGNICGICANSVHPLTYYGVFTCSKPFCQFELFDPFQLPYQEK